MTRLILFLLSAVAVAVGLSWLADRPGSLVVNWQGYEIETSVFRAVVLFAFLIGLSVFLWSIVRQIWTSPAIVGRYFTRRRQERGLDALSSGMIAIGAGDKSLATRYAVQARKALPNEPLTHLLRAQAAQLSGDRATSRRIFEAMLSSPDTEQLGLRGLFLEAEREGEREAAEQFAARALSLNPKLVWSFEALFDLQCKASNWAGALETLTIGRRNGIVEKPDADRRRAVLLTAQAQVLEDDNGAKALELAQEAHGLASDLVPAATIAGRQLASRGNTPKAAKIIEKTWKRSPHPDLAVVYAFARPGDSPRDRLERIKRLARSTPHSSEGPIAVAQAAIEARSWDEARSALQPLLDGRLSQRVCTLMARVEGGERENAGGVREWLARAVNAPRDPAWTADGVVSQSWAAISPVSGALDAFQWRVPVEITASTDAAEALAKIEELVTLGTAPVAAPKVAPPSRIADDIDSAEPAVMAANAVEVVSEPLRAPVSPPPVVTKATAVEIRSAATPAAVATGAGAAPGSKAGISEASISLSIEDVAVVAKPVSAAAGMSGPAATARPSIAVRADKPVSTGVPKSAVVGGAGVATAVFVPPRAPDDPGPDDIDVEAKPALRPGYIPSSQKR